MPTVTFLNEKQQISVPEGTTVLEAARRLGLELAAPCGGNGTCGKCRVKADGKEVLACRTQVTADLAVELPRQSGATVLIAGQMAHLPADPIKTGYLMAFDIGTTTVVSFLLSPNGEELAAESMLNPQSSYGADVISRIRHALAGGMDELTEKIRRGMSALIGKCCEKAKVSPAEIGVISVAGNPCMQQLFLGIRPDNLASVPFAPVLKKAAAESAAGIFPECKNALLLTVPDISGYVGADTVGCILASGMLETEETVLLVDIGTNGEMVLGSKDRMIACATAAGPALEGANIRFGMRGAEGAIDHVWLENGEVRYSVIGGGKAVGICGSGLLDAVAVGLRLGLINHRGRICNEDHTFRLTEDIWLTQEDIRQVQLAKGAISAGIRLMAGQLGVEPSAIAQVQLAGAFGSFLDPESACRIGLLPEELLDRIQIVGNAAGSGAKLLSLDKDLLPFSEKLTERIEFLELAGLKEFPRTFAKSMLFREETL